MKEKLIFAIVIAGVVLMLFGYMALFSLEVPEDYVVSDEYKKIMRYHGASVFYEDWKGNIWFSRDGKRIYVQKAGNTRTKTGI